MPEDPRMRVVEPFVAAYLDAFGRHDAAAVTACYAPDADLANPKGKVLHGKDEILAFFTRGFKQNLAEVRLDGVERRIRFVSDTVATVDLAATLQGEKDPKGQPRPPRMLRTDGTIVGNPQGGFWIVVGHLRYQGIDPPGGKAGGGAAPGAPSAAPAGTDPDG